MPSFVMTVESTSKQTASVVRHVAIVASRDSGGVACRGAIERRVGLQTLDFVANADRKVLKLISRCVRFYNSPVRTGSKTSQSQEQIL